MYTYFITYTRRYIYINIYNINVYLIGSKLLVISLNDNLKRNRNKSRYRLFGGVQAIIIVVTTVHQRRLVIPALIVLIYYI